MSGTSIFDILVNYSSIPRERQNQNVSQNRVIIVRFVEKLMQIIGNRNQSMIFHSLFFL